MALFTTIETFAIEAMLFLIFSSVRSIHLSEYSVKATALMCDLHELVVGELPE